MKGYSVAYGSGREPVGDLIRRGGYLNRELRAYKDSELFAILEDSERQYNSQVERLKKRVIFPSSSSHLDDERIISFEYVDDVDKYRIAAQNCRRILADRGHYILAGREIREE